MVRSFLAACAFAAAIGITPAHATDETLDADFSCLAVSLLLMNSDDPATRNAAGGSMMYWLGRVDGAGARDQLEQRMRTIWPSLTNELIQSERQRCGGEIIVRAQEMQAAAQRMQADGL